jgi:hypothetical protein
MKLYLNLWSQSLFLSVFFILVFLFSGLSFDPSFAVSIVDPPPIPDEGLLIDTPSAFFTQTITPLASPTQTIPPSVTPTLTYTLTNTVTPTPLPVSDQSDDIFGAKVMATIFMWGGLGIFVVSIIAMPIKALGPNISNPNAFLIAKFPDQYWEEKKQCSLIITIPSTIKWPRNSRVYFYLQCGKDTYFGIPEPKKKPPISNLIQRLFHWM